MLNESETNVNLGENQSANNVAAQPSTGSSVSAETTAAIPSEVPKEASGASVERAVEKKVEKTEKMLHQSEVNDIVGKAKRDAYEKARRELELKNAAINNINNAVNHGQQNQGIPGQLDEATVRRMITEEAQREALRIHATKVSGELVGKIDLAKSKYSDFEEVTKDMDLTAIAAANPNFIYLLNEFENSGDMVYEVARNPTKLVELAALSASAQPLARKAFKMLSDSIKRNETAAKAPVAPEPLSQVKPSTTGTDNGSMSVGDFRKQPWLRG